jgi:hypothetical protein
MWLSQAIIEALHQLPFWDSMVWTLSQKVLHPFPCFIERFSLNLRKPSDGFPNLIGFANGEILLEELLLDLSPRSNGIWFQRIQPILGLILEREWKRRIFKASSEKFCILMVVQISKNSSWCLYGSSLLSPKKDGSIRIMLDLIS